MEHCRFFCTVGFVPHSFGFAPTENRFYEPDTQIGSLRVLAGLLQKATIDPLVRGTALKVVRNCKSREDECELNAIYDAVKYGDPSVAPLRNGFKYVADPRFADYFTSPIDSLKSCLKGACGGDCDDAAVLTSSLAGALGWRVGLRAWGPKNSGGFSHVYGVALYPKRPVALGYGYTKATYGWKRAVALDTTVPDFNLGEEPPRGEVVTAWLA